jgi:hypothetical protein
MALDRIPERSILTPKTWGGTDPFLSQIKCIQRRSLAAAPSPASCLDRPLLERWMKRFDALGLTRGAIQPPTTISNSTSLARWSRVYALLQSKARGKAGCAHWRSEPRP